MFGAVHLPLFAHAGVQVAEMFSCNQLEIKMNRNQLTLTWRKLLLIVFGAFHFPGFVDALDVQNSFALRKLELRHAGCCTFVLHTFHGARGWSFRIFRALLTENINKPLINSVPLTLCINEIKIGVKRLHKHGVRCSLMHPFMNRCESSLKTDSILDLTQLELDLIIHMKTIKRTRKRKYF